LTSWCLLLYKLLQDLLAVMLVLVLIPDDARACHVCLIRVLGAYQQVIHRQCRHRHLGGKAITVDTHPHLSKQVHPTPQSFNNMSPGQVLVNTMTHGESSARVGWCTLRSAAATVEADLKRATPLNCLVATLLSCCI
jgi:hypothetical protein